jgi:hydrogenase maturation protein HypF
VRALSVHVTGVVQGVGFRPFVWGLARRFGVAGWVKNTSDGVHIRAEGEADALDAFVAALRDEAPPMAVVASVTVEAVGTAGFTAFEILPSETLDDAMTLVSPDIATCDACLAELNDPTDRRFGYPFINCTNCGPRFTIIEDVPYDRPMTTMRDFPMCDECASEYADPADRRFHAQPNACFRCGPRLYLNVLNDTMADEADASLKDLAWTPAAEQRPRPHRDPAPERARAEAIIAETVRLLSDGAIVGVKGLGGFQLACDATNEDAVARLRARKARWGKPLAVMMPSVQAARAYCEVSEAEEALLTSPAAPIVLLRLRDGARAGVSGAACGRERTGGPPRVPQPGETHPPHATDASRAPGEDCLSAGASRALAPSLAPGLRELGVMLPYTPLHHLLLSAFGGPLVMTSGNRSEEPIATGNAEALLRLADIADALLVHDREICSRYDDSVARVGSGVEHIRRARGYAPFPLRFPVRSEVDILACGPEQKNTFALVRGDHAFVSQHIGDMENAETLESYERTIALYERLFRVRPALVAYDLHPEYLSTKYALATGLPAIGVQHHHAHIASVAAEHGIDAPVLGVALDGTGYGADGTIWGGEWLLADWRGFTRLGHLRHLPLPGGAAAIRRPARMALGALVACDLTSHPGAAALIERLTEEERVAVSTMIERAVNTPPTSSMGRLFDAVASLAGVRDDARYEGQAAIEFEALADPSADGAYAFALGETAEGAFVIDSAPVLAAVLDDLARSAPTPVVSARFHRAVVAAIVDGCVRAARMTGVRTVALAGGVFMNRLVLEGATEGLRQAGLEPLTHLRLPANDGGISFGQAVVAWARRDEV